MIRCSAGLGSALLIAFCAFCATAPTLAATSSNLQDDSESGLDARPFNATRPAKAVTDPAEAAPALSPNPLWGVPLNQLTATGERPLFSPSRRPPAMVVASAPPPPAVRPPPPAPPEHPNLVLVGIVRGLKSGVAIFLDSATRTTVRLHTGEGHMGWVLQAVDRRTAELEKAGRAETLKLPVSGSQQALAQAIPGVPGARPPPPPPPPPPHPPLPH
jgi:hypothetical protein